MPNGILLPSLRAIQRNKLMKVVSQINELCKFLHASNLQATIDLIFTAARVSVEELGMSCWSLSPDYNGKLHLVPPWKIRLNSKLLCLRKDLSRLIAMNHEQLHNQKTINYLQNHYLRNGISVSGNIDFDGESPSMQQKDSQIHN